MAADTDKAEISEKDTQDSSMPDEGQKTADETSDQQAADESQETSGAPRGESEDLELPKSVSERTKEQFEKLKDRLRNAEDRLLRKDSMLGGQPEATQQAQSQKGDEPPLYDPKTGLVNVDALNQLQKRTLEAEKRATEVEAKVQRQVQNREVSELYEAHPDLKPEADNFNSELFDEAERIYLHSQAYPEKYGGQPLSQRQAADKAKTIMGKNEKPKEQEKELETKKQASAEASGRPTQGVKSKISSEEDMQRLRHATRLGDKDAMVERMRRIRESQTASE